MLVVDASFLAAAVLEETHTDFARGVLEDYSGDSLVAPGLVLWEIANVLWKKQRRGEITADQLLAIAEYIEALRLEHPSLPDGAELVDLIGVAAHADLTAYDCAYLVLAMREGASLATADKSLTRAASVAGVPVLSPFA